MTPQLLVVVPMRLESQRLPRKLLRLVNGVPLAVAAIRRIKATLEGAPHARLIAAVDAQEVAELLESELPAEDIVLTDSALPSGTDRVHAAAGLFLSRHPEAEAGLRAVINVQGDMPFVSAEALRNLYRFCLEQRPKMATLAEPWPEGVPVERPSAVKVLLNREGRAIYFSRHPIPYSRIPFPETSGTALCHYHVGVYAFDWPTLRQFCETPVIGYERAEGLEQLRALWMGVPIDCLVVTSGAGESSRGIDLPEDLEWAQSFGF
jgi:3-deoxy-manno-octulosonate cytidylyltransferase (CMP-KDO synthetase)